MQVTQNRHNNLKKKEKKVGGLVFINFKIYHKQMANKTMLFWHKDKRIGHWNRIRSSEIKPCVYQFSRRVPRQFYREKSFY